LLIDVSEQHTVSKPVSSWTKNLNSTNNAQQNSNHAFFHNAKYYFLSKITIMLDVFWDATLLTVVQNTEDSKERFSSCRKRQLSHSSSEMTMVYSYTILEKKLEALGKHK
jgi:hypothetical protein